MAVEGQQPIKYSFKAGGTITQYYFVKMSADNTVVVCSAVTDKPIGIAQAGASSGDTVEVVIAGVTKVNSDAALTYGNLIGTSADGQVAPYVAGTDTTKYLCGQMLTTTANAGEIGTAVINCVNIARGA